MNWGITLIMMIVNPYKNYARMRLSRLILACRFLAEAVSKLNFDPFSGVSKPYPTPIKSIVALPRQSVFWRSIFCHVLTQPGPN